MAISNRESYNSIAKRFAKDRSRARPPELLVKFSQLLPKHSIVLDIGCGSGLPNARYLVDCGIDIFGIDFSQELVSLAKSNVPEANFEVKDINDFQTEAQFDGVLAWDSLFHLDPDQHQKVFAKIFSMLKRGGYFLVTHGGKEDTIAGNMHGFEFKYSSPGPQKIKAELARLGFNILVWEFDMDEENGYLKVLVSK